MNSVLLVTGGGRGIGAATARLAAQRGYSVCVNYRSREDEAKRVVAEIEAGGGRALAVKADISVDEDVARMFDACDRQLGVLSGLVNNAGVVELQSRLDGIDTARLQRVFATNVFGAFACAREAVRRMSTRRGGVGGAIVNVSSAAARLGSGGGVPGLRGFEGGNRYLHDRARARGRRGRHSGQRGSTGLHLHGDARERGRASPRRPREGARTPEAWRECRRGRPRNSLVAVG